MMTLDLPSGLKEGEGKILLHSCCATCSGAVLKDLCGNGLSPAVYFYNPNIHPREEYEIRKKEIVRFAEKEKIPFIDADYDSDHWFDVVKGREEDPERGERCYLCFEMRFRKAAEYAHKNGFKVFASCLGISRWKDYDQVTKAGIAAASRFPGVTYWASNWRKKGGSQRMSEVAKEEQFYQQPYCGCIFSLRQANKRLEDRGRPKLVPLPFRKCGLACRQGLNTELGTFGRGSV